MFIAHNNEKLQICDFCMKSEPDIFVVSVHTHAVICSSCVKDPIGWCFTKKNPDPLADAPEAAQSTESA